MHGGRKFDYDLFFRKNLLTEIRCYVIVYKRDKDLGLFFMLKFRA